MDETERTEVDRSAVFDSFTYLDYDVPDELNGATFGEVIEAIEEKCGTKDEYRQIVAAMEQDPALKDCVFLGQSGDGSGKEITDELIQGAAFRDGDGNLYVAYRGTGNGRWLDNGVGMTAEKTEMQEAAANYFDSVVESYGADTESAGGKIIVTGHSKGGNEAQYVTLAAEHGDMVDVCYSFDGQGFSDKAVKSLQATLGYEEYEARLEKMYSICGEQDYVHSLGRTVIPEENTYYVGTSGDFGFAQAHSLKYMLGEVTEDGATFGGIQWADENGGHGSQGIVGTAAKLFSDKVMSLPEDQLDGTANTIMSIINEAMAGEEEAKHLGNYRLSAEDVADFIETMYSGLTAGKKLPDISEAVGALSGKTTAETAFVSADIGKLESFITRSGEAIKEFDSIKQGFEEANEKLLTAWKGSGADTYKTKTDSILEKVGGIADVLNTLNEGVVKDLIDVYKKTDRELYEYNINAGKEG